MKILQINTADTRGGAGKIAYRLGKELDKMGHQALLLVSRKYSSDKNVLLIRPYNNFKRKLLKKLTYYLANDIDLFRTAHILEMPEFKSADIIHCHNLHTNYFNLGILPKISAIKPVIWTFHDMWPITAHCAHSFDGQLKENGFFTCPSLDIYPPIAWHNEKYLENKKQKTYQKTNFHIVTPSKWLAGKVSQSTLKDKPISVIYNGVDTKVFRPLQQGQCRKELNLPQNKKVILIVAKRGQSNPWKGGNYSQEIINKYQNNDEVYFVDLGGNEDGSRHNVKTISYINDENTLAKYYSAADSLLYPSIADNCPLVVLEAQACGLPVVSFATGGIPELIDHQRTGYAARYKDVDDLITGIQWMLSRSPAEHTAISEAVIVKIHSNFSLNKMAEQYLELYKSLINKSLPDFF